MKNVIFGILIGLGLALVGEAGSHIKPIEARFLATLSPAVQACIADDTDTSADVKAALVQAVKAQTARGVKVSR